MKKFFTRRALPAIALILLAAAGNSHAAQLDIEIVNLTRGSWFTPLLVTAHPDSARLFTSGAAAST
ncbi:MAG: hypothetical protein ACR2P1_10725, partial [Pseudomonadales bacterium]